MQRLFPSRDGDHRDLHSFPTRRSSDLASSRGGAKTGRPVGRESVATGHRIPRHALPSGRVDRQDRKSTRLNSSHPSISYAVFCLKKKNGCHVGTWTRNQLLLFKSEEYT